MKGLLLRKNLVKGLLNPLYSQFGFKPAVELRAQTHGFSSLKPRSPLTAFEFGLGYDVAVSSRISKEESSIRL